MNEMGEKMTNEFVAGEIAFKYKQPGLSGKDLRDDILEALDAKDKSIEGLENELAELCKQGLSVEDRAILLSSNQALQEKVGRMREALEKADSMISAVPCIQNCQGGAIPNNCLEQDGSVGVEWSQCQWCDEHKQIREALKALGEVS